MSIQLRQRTDIPKNFWKSSLTISFEEHIKTIYGKARSKLKALSRVAPYIKLDKRKLLMNAYFELQRNYCPLV